jgi:glycosyltransferase involved in cell wall biosynthesis
MDANKNLTLALDLIGISSKYQGGATVFAHTLLAKFLDNSNIDVDVYVNESEREFYEKNFPPENLSHFKFATPRNNFLIKVIFRVFTSYFANSRVLESIQRYRWSEVINQINANSSACLSLSTYISFPLKGKTHVCTLHDIQEKAFPHFFTKQEKRIRHVNVKNTLRNVTGLQTSSEFVRTEIQKYYARDSSNLCFKVISEGYNSSELSATGIPKKDLSDGIKIAFPANYWPHKDHKTFFAALSNLNKKYNIEVISTGSLMGKEQEIGAILSKLEINNVQLRGYVSRAELVEIYKTSHIVISCSMYESSSLPLIEGAALNCIPVGSNIAPHIEMSSAMHLELFELGNALALETVLSNVIDKIYGSDGFECARNENSIGKFEWGALLPRYVEFLEIGNLKGQSR